MPIQVKCETCGFKAKANDAAAGKITRCPKCQSLIRVPDLNWANDIGPKEPEPPPFIKSPPVVSELPAIRPASVYKEPFDWPLFYSEMKKVAWGALIFVAVITWIATLHGSQALLHYLSMAFIVWLIARRICVRMPEKFRAWFVTLIVTSALFAWGRYDYRIERWEDTDDTGRQSYEDYFPRFGSREWPYYREYWLWMEKGCARATGGFTETGKQHGHWHSSVIGDDNPAYLRIGYEEDGIPGWYHKDVWYWYGEEITEGEWHLRNK
jgi:hypothetical protein